MSIFGTIMSKIFGHAEAAPSTASGSAASGGATATGGSTASGAGGATSGGATGQGVDVDAVLTDLASKNSQKLNWRESIVDLMKLLDLDSSFSARKELASELGYTGDASDSASMNIWLHKQVMQKLAENGGKVPDSLKH